MRLKPIGERVILKKIEQKEERTSSGIYLPKSEDKNEGVVEEAGTLKDGSAIQLNKGDKVLYGGYSSEEIEIENQKFLIVEYKDIIAKIEGEQINGANVEQASSSGGDSGRPLLQGGSHNPGGMQ